MLFFISYGMEPWNVSHPSDLIDFHWFHSVIKLNWSALNNIRLFYFTDIDCRLAISQLWCCIVIIRGQCCIADLLSIYSVDCFWLCSLSWNLCHGCPLVSLTSSHLTPCSLGASCPEFFSQSTSRCQPLLTWNVWSVYLSCQMWC